MQLHTINTGLFKLDGGAMFGVVPKAIWHKLNPADENNMCTWAMRCLLIETSDKLILIDTGIGNKQSDKFFSYYYLHGEDTLQKSLHQKGFSAHDVTDVILTHLHFDHCGGAVEKNGDLLHPAFKNATYWSTEKHWQWAINPNDREKASFLKENFLPLHQSGQLQFIEQHASPINELSFYISNGHTESMIVPVIQYKSHTIAYMADLIPSAAHIPIPYVMGYDVRPLDTMQEKNEFLQQAVAENYLLYFEHDPSIACVSIQETEKGIRQKEVIDIALL
jgi:glyoxylase-like metal-dependent hydrolase (beta-lactamase superfamily II)